MSEMVVWHEAGDRFRIAIRGHEVVVDQPVWDGGGDAGPTPTELFVASLAGCVAFYAGRYLGRHGIEPGGLEVDVRFAMAEDRPARVADVELFLRLPVEFPPEQLDRLRAVVEHCTVHNSITQPPEVKIALEIPQPAV
jgi:uncharacterized OsmC-like protein